MSSVSASSSSAPLPGFAPAVSVSPTAEQQRLGTSTAAAAAAAAAVPSGSSNTQRSNTTSTTTTTEKTEDDSVMNSIVEKAVAAVQKSSNEGGTAAAKAPVKSIFKANGSTSIKAATMQRTEEKVANWMFKKQTEKVATKTAIETDESAAAATKESKPSTATVVKATPSISSSNEAVKVAAAKPAPAAATTTTAAASSAPSPSLETLNAPPHAKTASNVSSTLVSLPATPPGLSSWNGKRKIAAKSVLSSERQRTTTALAAAVTSRTTKGKKSTDVPKESKKRMKTEAESKSVAAAAATTAAPKDAKKRAKRDPTTTAAPKESKERGAKSDPESRVVWSGVPPEEVNGLDFSTGWLKKTYSRVTDSNHVDSYWYSPQLQFKFRSRTELQKFAVLLQGTNGNEQQAVKLFKERHGKGKK
jgi:hypothetical protein